MFNMPLKAHSNQTMILSGKAIKCGVVQCQQWQSLLTLILPFYDEKLQILWLRLFSELFGPNCFRFHSHN